MGFLDFLLHPSGKARGWDALPQIISAPERKASWTIDDYRAVVVSPLVHGPGTTDQLYGQRGDGNSAVYACLSAIATALAEPPLRVYRTQAGDRTELDETPLGSLLERPNPHMTLSALLAYLSNCLHVDGNAYWRKMRAGNPETGNVVELWPISPSRLEPKTVRDSGDFISFYRYYIRPGVHEDIPVENIVHFRMGLRDGDHRLGDGPIRRLAREVSSDDQATRYADRLLANFAAPGLSVEFDKDTQAIDQATADEIKVRIQAAYSGDNLGAVSVMSPGAKLAAHGFSPEQMDMKTLHRVPEERIAAVLGVPAIVAGLGAGLDRSTYSNFAEAREAFTEMKLCPFWRLLGDVLTMSLVPDFASDRTVSVAFNIDDVRALQDDQNAKAVRLSTYVAAGILTTDEARAEIGHEPLPEQPAAPALPDSPPEARSRPRIVTLHREIKAPDDLPGLYEGLRDDRLPDWESELRTFLASQQRRVNAKLRAGADTAEELVVEGEAILLGRKLTPLQEALLEQVHSLVVGELGLAFELDDPSTRRFLQEAGANIVGITDTTREAVRAALIEGQANGEGIDKLAARLRDLPAFNDARARAVARTELGHSANTAALANYRASGVVVGVRVFDGDYDGACQAMNGRTFALGQEPPTLQHPNCRRAFAPIVDAAELTASA
jgi:HK97 family phage portal protein